MTTITPKQIMIINAGGQYCHLIARRIREAGVQAKICSPHQAEEELRLGTSLKGIIISGGPSSVYAADRVIFPDALFAGDIPLLGVCYGHQALASALGGTVRRGQKHEYGESVLEVVGY